MTFGDYIRKKADQVRQAKDDYILSMKQAAAAKREIARKERAALFQARREEAVKYARRQAAYESQQRYKKLTAKPQSYGFGGGMADSFFGSVGSQRGSGGFDMVGSIGGGGYSERRVRIPTRNKKKHRPKSRPKYKYKTVREASPRFDVVGF